MWLLNASHVRIQNAYISCSAIWARMRFMVKVTMTHGTQFWTSLFGAWAYQLKISSYGTVELVDWKCLGQGKIFLTVFHWRSVNTTFDVSWQYARADLGITLRASAALLRCALRCRLLSIMNLCLCFYFWVYSMVESIYLLCLAVSRLKGVLVTWPDSAWVKRQG